MVYNKGVDSETDIVLKGVVRVENLVSLGACYPAVVLLLFSSPACCHAVPAPLPATPTQPRASD